MQYKKTGKSIAEIGRELRVGTILEGSVRKAGDRLRITAQLIDVASQGHLWSQDYDRTLRTCSRSRATSPQHVAQALQSRSSPPRTPAREGGNRRPGGVQRLSPGPLPFSTWSKQGLEKSIGYFEQAIARDPTSPRPTPPWHFRMIYWPTLAISHRTRRFQRSKRRARTALAIDATTAEAVILHWQWPQSTMTTTGSRRRGLSPCPRAEPEFRGRP